MSQELLAAPALRVVLPRRKMDVCSLCVRERTQSPGLLSLMDAHRREVSAKGMLHLGLYAFG